MDFKRGQIVKARAGRDKDGFFVITELDGGYAYIADGRRRKVQKPKKKKLIHLLPTKRVAEEYRTNREIIRILSDYYDKSL